MTEESTVATMEPGTGSRDYTFLVGENVYLRTFAPGDEKNATSWRNSVFPKSPELVEKWIKEDLPKEGKKDRGHMAIVRKSDDVIVGSIIFHHGDVSVSGNPYVDPLYGDVGQRWLVEAIELAAKWVVDECFNASYLLELAGHQAVAIEELKQRGFVETARWREMFEQNGERYDKVVLVYFSRTWVERLGNPMNVELPMSGTGEVRPVPARATLAGDPPVNAVMVGQRVYLRPVDKKEGKYFSDSSRMEEETFFNIGRHLISQVESENQITMCADQDFPADYWFAVCLRETDEVIGSVGLIDLNFVHRTAETGSFFQETKWRGHGYGSEAKQLLLEYSFEILGLHMVQSFVFFSNTRSAAALRKQGYTEAGRLCWLYPFEGGFGSMVVFDLLADEWRALPRG